MTGPHDPTAPHQATAFWAEQAARYDATIDLLEPELRHVTDALLDAVRAGPGVRLLDLACGPGHVTAAAGARGAEALGIDASSRMVEAARRRFPDSRFVVGDMLHPPRGPWDAITCRLGAHHVDGSWLEAAFRVLGPGGRLAIAEMGPTDGSAGRDRMRAPAEWARRLEGAGFEDPRTTTRTLRLGTLAVRDPRLGALVHEGHDGRFRDGPVHIISGRKPAV